MAAPATSRNHRPRKGRNFLFGPGDIFGSREYEYDLDEARREGKRASKKRAREVEAPKAKLYGSYKGYQIYKQASGEYFSTLDRDSWYETPGQVRKSIDDWRKGHGMKNPLKHYYRSIDKRGKPVYYVDARKAGRLIKVSEDEAKLAVSTGAGTLGTYDSKDKRFSQNPSADDVTSLERQAAAERSPEALARLYKYASSHRLSGVKSAVERRAEDLRIPHSQLTRSDHYSPFRNPSGYRGRSVAELERMRVFAAARAVDNDWMVRAQGRDDVEAIDKALKAARKREAKKAANPRRRGSNPEDEAVAMYRDFHGAPPDRTTEVREEVHEHEWLSEVGMLTEIWVDTLTGLRLHLTWTGAKDMPQLTTSEDDKWGTQLYIKGGDQELSLATVKMEGRDWLKEPMVIGEFSPPDPCSRCGADFSYNKKRNVHVCANGHTAGKRDRVHNITYRTKKDFDKFQQIDYQHALGEESGVRPMLEYEPRVKHLLITGGQYRIERPLFDTSPGIEN